MVMKTGQQGILKRENVKGRGKVGTSAHGVHADNIDVFFNFGHLPCNGEKGNRGIEPS